MGDVASFSKGKGISKSDIVPNGVIECIRYGELYTHYGATINEVRSKTSVDIAKLVLSESNDVIIPASGESMKDIATASCVLKSGVALGGDLNIIKTNNDGVFLSYYLNSKKKLEIANLSQGISVVHLYSSQLRCLSLNLPKLEEQRKIAAFLALLDKRIQTQNKIIENLKSLIKVVTEKSIAGFDNNSEIKTLAELGQIFSGLSGKSKEDFGIGKPYVQYKQIFDSGRIDFDKCGLVKISSNETQTKLRYGDVCFTISSETPGEIGMSSVLLDDPEEMYLNSFCFGYRINSFKILDPIFARYFFRSGVFRDKIVKLAQGSTRYNMSKTEFLKIKIKLPSFKEQIRIANLLSSIDSKIDVDKWFLQKLEEQKEYLLQNLFI